MSTAPAQGEAAQIELRSQRHECRVVGQLAVPAQDRMSYH